MSIVSSSSMTMWRNEAMAESIRKISTRAVNRIALTVATAVACGEPPYR